MGVDSTNIEWEEDPNYFIYHEVVKGKTKMHVHAMELKDWVKIDKTYPDQMRLRTELLKTSKDVIFVSNEDENAVACKWEFFDILIDYLPQRFPNIFELQDGCIYNKALDEYVSTKRDDPEDPLIRAGKLTQEDWCIVEWSDAAQGYVLTSGVVYFPMRWSLQAKFNQAIAGIHDPVESFQKHLVSHVYAIFKKMRPDAPIWRANWAVFNDLDGPLDLYAPLGSIDRNEVNKHTIYDKDKTGRDLVFRAEYQTLRKLPKNECIVFGIRTYQRYIEDFKNHPDHDSQGLINAIEGLNPDDIQYKGAEFWRNAALKYLNHIIDERKEKSDYGRYLPMAVAAGAVAVGLIYAFRMLNK